MRVENGWNTDFGKVKFNVELDEGNLKELLGEHGLPPDAPLTVSEKFVVLHSESIAYAKRIRLQVGDLTENDKGSLRAQVTQHEAMRDHVLDKAAKRITEEAGEE